MGVVFAVLLLFAVPRTRARGEDSARSAGLSVTRIVAGMQSRSQIQEQGLRQYRALRSYSVEYHGLGTITARMQVEVSYDAAHGKSFRIVSQGGSALLRDAVLKRAVKSEIEASKDKGSTALSPANYSFRLLGSGNVGGRPVYILAVDPLKPDKFLYRGTIWVDAASFGVVKIHAAPAKNPSFWISHAEISVTDELTNGFWLPEETRSRTEVRLGGTAMLTIDYGRYQIDPRAAASGQVLLPAESMDAALHSR
jgi:hypothetical protein